MAVTPRKRKASTKRSASEASPDPLAATVSPEVEDCIVVTPSTRVTRSAPRAKPVVFLSKTVASPSGSKPKKPKLSRTPKKDKPQPRADEATLEVQHATPRPNGTERAVNYGVEEANPFISAETSRALFLSNEASKRQREARTFQFQGDHEAPVALRSGKKMRKQGDNELDEYGGVIEGNEETAEHEMDLNDDQSFEIVEDIEPITSPTTLKRQERAVDAARRDYYTQLIAILDRPSHVAVETDVGPNDAVRSLANLLIGTVERGEGNSCLLIGPRGSGKTRNVTLALAAVVKQCKPKCVPVVVRLDGLVHITDRLAIREMGRQINEAEGKQTDSDESLDDEAEEEYAPTTLPSHLLHQLTSPSARSVIVVLENFDLFTEHPRQALLYCLLDVAQSVNAGLGAQSGRGVAVVGVTARVDTLLLLEKRVKSRFSHRVIRTVSPLANGGRWDVLFRSAVSAPSLQQSTAERAEVEAALGAPAVVARMDRLSGMTTDVRVIARPFMCAFAEVADGRQARLEAEGVLRAIDEQIVLSGWGDSSAKLKGLSHPALAILIIGKHLAFAGREDFNFAQADAEYTRFSRTKLVGSGKARWPSSVLRKAFESLIAMGLLIPVGPSRAAANHAAPRFARVRSLLQPFEVVQFFKAEGSSTLSVELGNWGRLMGGHA